MVQEQRTLGIIGGSGMLGAALLRAVLGQENLQGGWQVTISNRSGVALDWAASVAVTTSNAELAAGCDTVLLCLPPAVFADMELDLSGKFVISVMAGVDLAALQVQTGASRVVRAMSSPAAAQGLAYSPWVASAAVDQADRQLVTRLFEACGTTDEIAEEPLLDHITAMTGPVPGFVAFFAEAMINHATAQGIPPRSPIGPSGSCSLPVVRCWPKVPLRRNMCRAWSTMPAPRRQGWRRCALPLWRS